MPEPYKPLIPGDWIRLEYLMNEVWQILNVDTSLEEMNTITAGMQTDIAQNAADIAAIDDVAGSNTEVQFNDNNNFGASANFKFNKLTNIVTVNGTIQTTRLLAGGVKQ